MRMIRDNFVAQIAINREQAANIHRAYRLADVMRKAYHLATYHDAPPSITDPAQAAFAAAEERFWSAVKNATIDMLTAWMYSTSDKMEQATATDAIYRRRQEDGEFAAEMAVARLEDVLQQEVG